MRALVLCVRATASLRLAAPRLSSRFGPNRARVFVLFVLLFLWVCCLSLFVCLCFWFLGFCFFVLVFVLFGICVFCSRGGIRPPVLGAPRARPDLEVHVSGDPHGLTELVLPYPACSASSASFTYYNASSACRACTAPRVMRPHVALAWSGAAVSPCSAPLFVLARGDQLQYLFCISS